MGRESESSLGMDKDICSECAIAEVALLKEAIPRIEGPLQYTASVYLLNFENTQKTCPAPAPAL